MEHRAADAPVDDLAALMQGRKTVVLSGAGMSTESGIPDYRGPQGSLRARKPMTYREFAQSAENRRRYWARSASGWARVRGARPNAGHLAVARLEATGHVAGVITQNIDNLHSGAGCFENSETGLHRQHDGRSRAPFSHCSLNPSTAPPALCLPLMTASAGVTPIPGPSGTYSIPSSWSGFSSSSDRAPLRATGGGGGNRAGNVSRLAGARLGRQPGEAHPGGITRRAPSRWPRSPRGRGDRPSDRSEPPGSPGDPRGTWRSST